MDRIEQVEHPERFQKEKPPLWKRAQRFLADHVLWIAVTGLVVGLIAFFMLFGYYSGQSPVSLNVDLGDIVGPRKEKDNQEKSKFDQVLDAIARKNKVPTRNRYDDIVNGREIISTNFGQLTYVQGEEEETEEVLPVDTVATDSVSEAPVRVVKVYVSTATEVDTVSADTVAEVPRPRNPFASVRLASNHETQYIPAYVYGDQTVGRNSRIRLRLGETIKIDNHRVPEGTVFSGRAAVANDAIYVSVTRIGRYNVAYEVYDDDYSHGIVLNRAKNEDLEESLTQSAYRSSNRGVADLPYDIARDVTRAIVNRKRRKRQEIRLNDGDPVFIAKK